MTTTLLVQRVCVYDTGMRVVEANLTARIQEWALHHNTTVEVTVPKWNEDWTTVEFESESHASLFALSFQTTLSIRAGVSV